MQAFTRKHIILVPNTYHTGYETDLLLVRSDLRLVDIEIKVSRADLRADQHKDKWWRYGPYAQGYWSNPNDLVANHWVQPEPHKERREWPIRVWKHYYALPKEIWTPELAAEISPKSGILLFAENRSDYGPEIVMHVHRQAKPRKDAKPIDASEALDVARLCNARMWDAYDAVRRVTAKQCVA
jgi:hypothetical protein